MPVTQEVQTYSVGLAFTPVELKVIDGRSPRPLLTDIMSAVSAKRHSRQ